MMDQFCKDVIEFLQSEYNDAYSYNIEISYDIYSRKSMELRIKISPSYSIKVNDSYMEYIFALYNSKEFCRTKNLYCWQKELVSIIER